MSVLLIIVKGVGGQVGLVFSKLYYVFHVIS